MEAIRALFVTRDALATLGFGYERRAEYFKDELAALIAWSYKDGVPTSSIVGSYAGAVGYPQFMPSNIPKFGSIMTATDILIYATRQSMPLAPLQTTWHNMAGSAINPLHLLHDIQATILTVSLPKI